MRFTNQLSRIKHRLKSALYKPEDYKKSYAQAGEDLILNHLFNELKVALPTYLDIGAHDPSFFSNTKFFYDKGCRGVNIEPDPYLIERFYKSRPLDKNLNIGIGFEETDTEADFYIMSIRTLNTFSKEEAKRVEKYGSYKIDHIEKIPLKKLDAVLKEYFPEKRPDLISLDIEGLDLEVLKSMKLEDLKKTVFCIETINYTEDKTEKKNSEIIDLMTMNGFFVYADTYINSIFVHKEYWSSR